MSRDSGKRDRNPAGPSRSRRLPRGPRTPRILFPARPAPVGRLAAEAEPGIGRRGQASSRHAAGGPGSFPRERRAGWGRVWRLPGSPAARRLLGAISLFLVIGLGLTLFLTSPTFGVREIMVVGSVHLSSAEVVRICDVSLGANIMKVPTKAIRDRLLRNPRIAEATVSRTLPGRLVVRVVEREGVILLPCEQRFAEVDSSGLPVEFHRYVGALGLPVVTGVAGEGVTLGAKLTGDKLTLALTCAGALGPAGRPAVAEIHVDEGGELTLYTRDGLPVYVGEATDLAAKAGALLGILADIEANHLEVSYVDVRYPRYPVVGSEGGQAEPVDWADPDVFPVFGEP